MKTTDSIKLQFTDERRLLGGLSQYGLQIENICYRQLTWLASDLVWNGLDPRSRQFRSYWRNTIAGAIDDQLEEK